MTLLFSIWYDPCPLFQGMHNLNLLRIIHNYFQNFYRNLSKSHKFDITGHCDIMTKQHKSLKLNEVKSKHLHSNRRQL